MASTSDPQDTQAGAAGDLAARVAELETRVEHLEQLDRLALASSAHVSEVPGSRSPTEVQRPEGEQPSRSAEDGEGQGPAGRATLHDPQVFWALEGLRARSEGNGAVLLTGTVELPTGERAEWQEAFPVESLLESDWSLSADTLAALGHPIRLLLLREVLRGVRTTAELGAIEELGTTGQLYHHLRQLVAAGWLRTSGRGRYEVPAPRVVPLLVIIGGTQP